MLNIARINYSNLPIIMLYNESVKIKNTIKEIYLSAIIIFIVEIFFLLVFFRKLRSFFPQPRIEENGIVGFSQYFGYPLYFDNFVFFLFLLSPVMVAFIILVRRKTIRFKTDGQKNI